MSERPVLLLLQDIAEACSRIEEYTGNKNLEDFQQESIIRDAVERNIEIIGEACNKLPYDFIQAHPEMEWHKPISMRNRLIHGYFAVDIPLLWNTAIEIVPAFHQNILELIEGL